MNRTVLTSLPPSQGVGSEVWPPYRCPVHPEAGLSAVPGPGGGLSCPRCRGVYPVWGGIPRLVPQVNWEHDGFRAEAAQWDREAEEYEGRRGGDGRYMAGIEPAVRSLDAQPGATVLDAGCGTGLTTRRLVATGCSVTGMDLSVESLVYLRDRTAGGELRVVQGDVTSLPFGDGSFDRVLCATTLQQLEGNDRRQACIREVVRVLRPGGRLVLTVQQYSVLRRWAGWARERPTGRESGTSSGSRGRSSAACSTRWPTRTASGGLASRSRTDSKSAERRGGSSAPSSR